MIGLFYNIVLLIFFTLLSDREVYSQNNIIFKKEIEPKVKAPVFEEITIADGLPENSAVCITQDYLGYLWIGTQNGLAQFNGYSMKVYTHDENNKSSISNNEIVTIYEDRHRTLWVGTTYGGLNKFDRAKETFTRYTHNPDNPATINSDRIRYIYEDKAGRFWIGTLEGLNLFDVKKEIFSRYDFIDSEVRPNNPSARLQHKLAVNTIIEDTSTGDLLIGTEINGLWKFGVKEKKFSKYELNSENSSDQEIGCVQSFYKGRDGRIWIASTHTLSALDTRNKTLKTFINFPMAEDEQYTKYYVSTGSVIEDREGLIWCGFFNVEKGLFCFNPANEDLRQYDLISEMPKQSLFNQIFTIYEDHSSVIWVGTELSGLKKLDKRKNQFNVLSSNINLSSDDISHPVVYSGIYDSNGYIWYGTKQALDKYDLKKGTYTHYLIDEECIKNSFYTMEKDKSGYIWLGTSNCGLIRFNPQNGTYSFLLNEPGKSKSLADKKIWSMCLDKQDILWIGTDGFGLYKYDIKKNFLTQYVRDPKDSTSLSHNQVKLIFEDSLGNLWVGTHIMGLNKFDREKESFTRCGFKSINAIYEDKQGNFWIGDYFTGLNLYDREKGLVKATYGSKDGLLQNYILGILEDDLNNLWIATEIGLSKFNKQNVTFKNYTKEDGIPGMLTIRSSCFKDPDGKMYFNTNAGQIVFHPESIEDDFASPQVVLSGISLFNRPDQKLHYDGFISELEEIILPYDHNDLRFDFVGLHFSEPARNKYKYILENFDDEWLDAGSQRNATYTNLNPGKYIFRVTASNKDGFWNQDGATISITILHPWWQTWLAYIFYSAVLIGLVIVTWKIQAKRIRNKHELEMTRFEARKMYEVDELKSRFFTNISHEFRTPLTLILGPSKQLLDNIKDETSQEQIKLINRSAKKLNKLVDELLDIAKIEAGEMKLKACPIALVSAVRELALSFCSLAERKKIKFNITAQKDEITTYIDKDKFDKILTNVLSNAIKFTASGGEVNIYVIKDETTSKVIITDTGMGIPAEQVNKIFDRFYQVDGSHTREQEGTGIGLSLTKELIELHKGKIEVESKEGRGTTFRLIFQLGKDHFHPDEICEEELEKDKYELKELNGFDDYFRQKSYTADEMESTGKPVLLIVEDNPDVREYITMILGEYYQVIEAEDGEDGLKKSIDKIPDLIISDIMMPKMDGFKMCTMLKSDERTSHIPIIMLTAKATIEDKISGLEIGADSYIMKPFDALELKARIKNLLEQRNRLHEHFRKYGLVDTEVTTFTPADQMFLKKAVDIISKHISDSQFGVKSLSEQLAVSKSLLVKKTEALFGEPPSELIKRIRLNKAAKLLERKIGNVSEIALEVGFNNPSYFAECFKKQFGVSPSQYHQQG